MQTLITKLDAAGDRFGSLVSWLSLALVLVTGLVVLLRYAFNWAPIALQESMTYLHASLFMLGAAYSLKHDKHVRVDVFYRNFDARRKALVNIGGTILLLFPTCLFSLIICWPYVADSWSILERSVEGNGLPFIYLLKTLLLIQPVLLMLQGIIEIMRNIKNLQEHAA